MEEIIDCTRLECLDKGAIIAIETALRNGYDVEVRKNIHGATVASVGKKVVYKGTK